MGLGTRWFLFCLGLCIAVAGACCVALGLIADAVASPDVDSTGGLVAACIGIALLITAFLLCRSASEKATAVAGMLVTFPLALTGALCVLTGLILFPDAPVYLDPHRAALRVWLGAGVCFALAVAAALNWWYWLRVRGSHESVRHLKQLLAIGFGALIFTSGLSSAYYAVAQMLRYSDAGPSDIAGLKYALVYAGSAGISLGAGTLLVWHGAASLTGVPSGRLRLPPIWVPLFAALLAIAIGGLMLQADVAVGLMPLTHVAATIFPGLTLLTLAARGGRRLPEYARATWREVLTMVSYGAAVAASIAAIVNTVALFGGVVVVLAARGSFDGISSFHAFQRVLSNADIGKSDQLILLLAVIAVLGPFNEEFWKGYGVRMLRQVRLNRYQAFLLGAAAGIGFGAVEANEYGVGAFVGSPYRWWDGVLLRGGASSLHALASGMVGLGWYYVAQGQRRRGLLLYLLAVGLHGSWNGINVLAAARVLPWFKDLNDHTLEIALEAAVGVLALGVIAMLWRLSASLADEEREHLGPPPALPAADEPPYRGSTPWQIAEQPL